MTAPTFLVRHAMTGHNAAGKVRAGTDVPVSSEGKAQIAQIAAFFKGKPVQRVLTSDTRRAGETAHAIAQATGAKVIEHPGLRPWEGAKPGQDVKTAAPLLKHLFEHPDERGPGGMTYREFYTHLLGALHGLKPGDVAVTHGRNVMTAWSLLQGGGKFHPMLPPHDPSPTNPGDVFLVRPRGLVKVFHVPQAQARAAGGSS